MNVMSYFLIVLVAMLGFKYAQGFASGDVPCFKTYTTVFEKLVYLNETYAHWTSQEFEEVLQEVKGLGLSHTASIGSHTVFNEFYFLVRSKMTRLPTSQHYDERLTRCQPTCRKYGTCNEEFARCDCLFMMSGDNCGLPVHHNWTNNKLSPEIDANVIPEFCIAGCSGRGICAGLVCHCFPGFFGADCALSLDGKGRVQLFEGRGYTPAPQGPKVYVYDLPPQHNAWGVLWVDRPTFTMFWERMASDRLRVASPAEADYFFLPVSSRMIRASVTPGLEKAVEYVKKHYPTYWGRHQGRDHLFTQAGDGARCENRVFKRLLPNATALIHFGLTRSRRPFSGSCAVRDQDIVIPALNGDFFIAYHKLFNDQVNGNVRPAPPVVTAAVDGSGDEKRPLLALLAGGICQYGSAILPPCSRSMIYSFGVREQIYVNYHGRAGWVVEPRVPDMVEQMARTQFCIAPSGYGYGKRQSLAAISGCIPVVISDDVLQPFEPFLNYSDFGVVIAEADLNRTDAILRAIPPQERERKRAALTCVARHQMFSSVLGALKEDGETGEFDAVNFVWEILRARRRHRRRGGTIGLSDQALAQKDAKLRDFVACRRGRGAAPPPLPMHTLEVSPWCRGERLFHRPFAIGGSALCPTRPSEILRCGAESSSAQS